MMEEKKLVPKRRFNAFGEKWETNRLGTICDLTSSKRVHSGDYVEDGIPFFRGTEITKIASSSKLEDVFYISNEHYMELKRNYGVPEIGDILITVVGTLGNVNLITNDIKFYFKDGNLIWVKNIKIDSSYLSIYLGNGKGKQRLLESAAGSNQGALTMDKMRNILVIFPSEEEQQKIGEFFKVLDERIANQERKIAKVKALKTAYLTEMFPQEGETVPKRRFKEFQGKWKDISLEEALDYEQPNSYIVDEEDYSDKFTTPVLTAGQSFLLGFTQETHGIKNASLDNPVVIFDDFTTSSHFVDFSFKVKSSALKILIPDKNKYNSYFLYQVLKNIDYKPKNHERHWISIFSSFTVKVPAKSEQKKIGEFFKNLDDQIATEEKKLAKLKKMKEAYLEEMFV